MGSKFKELWNDPEFMTDGERGRIDLEVELIEKLVEAREEKGITQQQLAEMAGLKQSAIARLENLTATPQIDTLFKILKPLGYTLAIVPEQKK